MRGIIEKPGEEVGGSVEEGGEDGDEREIGEASTEVATGEEREAKKGEASTEVAGHGFVPVEAGDEIESKSGGVEAGNEEKERNEGEKEVEEN